MKNNLLKGLIISVLGLLIISHANAVVVNGVPQDDGTVTNPNYYYTPQNTTNANYTGTQNTQSQLNSYTAGANTNASIVQNSPINISYVNGRWSESTLRSYLGQYNLKADSNATLYGLGNFAITGAISLKKTVDYYTRAVRGANRDLNDLNISAGTETYGADKPVLDVDSEDNLDYFIEHMATDRGNNLLQLGDDYIFRNGDTWRIIFGPSNGAFVKNAINFFGLVRDNFNVPHPMITAANTPASVNFVRNLGVGAKGQDVYQLQQLLNTDPYTRVAAAGPGAAGAETTYFGNLTKQAVMRWQYKYNEILDAAGITTPTGFFGPFTRASMTAYSNYINSLKLGSNQLALQYPTPTKPLEDVPLDSNVSTDDNNNDNSSNNNSNNDDDILLNQTPTAPPYPDPAYNADPINPNPVFYPTNDPYNYGTQDPNNAGNSSNIGPSPTQQNSSQNILGQLTQILLLSQLTGGLKIPGITGGGTSGGGILGGGSGTSGLPDYGGMTLYNSLYSGNKYKPCGASAVVSLQVNTNSANKAGIHPISLLQNAATTLVNGSPVVGACVIGKYAPGADVAQCVTYVNIEGKDVPIAGMPGIQASTDPMFQPYKGLPVSGVVTNLSQRKDTCS